MPHEPSHWRYNNGRWNLKSTHASCLSWMRRQRRERFTLGDLLQHGHTQHTIASLIRMGLASTGTNKIGHHVYFMTKEGEKA